MDENPIENPWRYDAMVNDPQNLHPVPFEAWQPTDFHVRIQDTNLSDEAAKQLQMEVRALIEAELKTDAAEPPISVSVAGLGLRADRAAILSQSIEARVRAHLSKNSEAE